MAKTIDVRCDKTGVIFDVSTKRIFVEDVKTLTNGQIAVLECGDFVVKQTGNQKHTYKVTYKEENVGLCITYEDATLIETVSYDWNGEKWVYNSTDITTLDSGGGTTVVANPTLAGTEATLLSIGIDGTNYKVGAKPLYHHQIGISGYDPEYEGQESLWVIIDLVCEVPRFNNFAQLKTYLDNFYDNVWTGNDGMVHVNGILNGDADSGALLLMGSTDEDLEFIYAPKNPVTVKNAGGQNMSVFVNAFKGMWFSPDGSGESDEPASFTDRIL